MPAEWEKERLRDTLAQRRKRLTDIGRVPNTGLPMQTAEGFDGFRQNAVFDDITGQELTGFAFIGTMNTGP